MKILITTFSFLLILGLLSCGPSAPTTAEADASATATPSKQMGGIALYTLRDDMAKDPKGTLKAVAELGYAYIEAAGYEEGKFYGMEPAEFKAYLDEVGLQPMSSHMGVSSLDEVEEMVADVKAAGFQYFVIPVPPMGHFSFDQETGALSMSDDIGEVMEIINAIAETCAAAGLGCLYHNHDFEFKANSAGIVPLDYFIENSNPEHLDFQLDLYWATKAGVDPMDYFHKAPGRIKSWHVKDMDDQGRFAPVGQGNIDFARLLPHRAHAGLEFYLVEQDQTFGQTPMEAIAISHAALAEIGFE